MLKIPEEAQKNKPTKPLNPYFKYRCQKLIEFKDLEDRTKRAKQDWDRLSVEAKQQLNKEYNEDLVKYSKDLDDWKARYGITAQAFKLTQNKASKKFRTEEKNQQRVKAIGDKAVAKVAEVASTLKKLEELIPVQDEYRVVCEQIRQRMKKALEEQIDEA